MAEAWISTHHPKFEAGELSNFAIVLRPSGELIGAIGLTIMPRFERAEMGYWSRKAVLEKRLLHRSRSCRTPIRLLRLEAQSDSRITPQAQSCIGQGDAEVADGARRPRTSAHKAMGSV